MAASAPVSMYYDGDEFPEGSGNIRGSRIASYSQAPKLFDQSHLKPGNQAALVTADRTLEMYRENAKKTNDPELMFDFSTFLIEQSKGLAGDENPLKVAERDGLIKEAITMLKRLADRGFPDAQYFLADCYANGIGTTRGRQDFEKAFPLFAMAAKHGHPDACYRAGTCCEHGWGTRRESAKAVQFYKKAAVGLHPGAMYRLGTAELNGNLSLARKPKEGVKWLKRSAEHATDEFPHALHELALLHERGIENVVFIDFEYAAELLARAAELGYAPSAFKLGECYEYGKMGCPVDPALSIHYYNIAAQQNHADACFALTSFYLVGAEGVLPQSDTEAYLWAKKAAELGSSKAQYALGYFLETGVGTEPNMQAAMKWYRQAADAGDKRASKRVAAGFSGNAGASALDRRVEMEAMKDMMRDKKRRGADGAGGKDGDSKDGDKDGCVIM
ncbi:Chitin synthase 4 [Cryptotrichosporon argae]